MTPETGYARDQLARISMTPETGYARDQMDPESRVGRHRILQMKNIKKSVFTPALNHD